MLTLQRTLLYFDGTPMKDGTIEACDVGTFFPAEKMGLRVVRTLFDRQMVKIEIRISDAMNCFSQYCCAKPIAINSINS